jgi:4a-hydroxytetrahydrobiopterin dehydratase
VIVRWTTHNPAGLSDKDVDMARFCDLKAAEIGVKVAAPRTAAEAKPSPSSAGQEEGNVLEQLLPAGGECKPCSGTQK